MKNLKVPLIHLFLFLAIVFNLEKISYGNDNVLELNRFVDILILAMIILSIFFRVFQKLSSYANLSFWVIVYFGLWFLFNRNSIPQINLQVTLIEVVFVSVAAFLSREVAINLFEVESTLDRLVFASFKGRTLSMDEAADEIETELDRSRRYQRSLSVLVIEPDAKTINENMMPTVEEIKHNLARRYAMGRISEVINRTARRPDLIIKQEPLERFVMLCPETAGSNSSILIQRLRDAVKADLGISIAIGMATFPDDALTFEDLLHKAGEKLVKSPGFPLPITQKDETLIKKP